MVSTKDSKIILKKNALKQAKKRYNESNLLSRIQKYV